MIVYLTALVHAQDPHSDSYSPTSSNSVVDVSLKRELVRQALEDAEKRKIYQPELNQEFSVSPQDWDGLGLCLRLVAYPVQTFSRVTQWLYKYRTYTSCLENLSRSLYGPLTIWCTMVV